MTKFKAEDKVRMVLRYLDGNESMNDIAKEEKVSLTILSGWIKLYEHQGSMAFIKSYTSYSKELKLNVIQYMNEMGTSSYESAAIFNISSPGMIRNWRKKFEQGGIDALQTKKKGRPSMKKEAKKIESMKSPAEGTVEALQAKIERLEMENAYLKKLNTLVQIQEKLQTKSKRK
jgi:transposase